jgi:hypothetical protein
MTDVHPTIRWQFNLPCIALTDENKENQQGR